MEPLFEIIKSLTKAEKSHCRKYIALHSYNDKPPQLKLFDLLDKEDSYLEKEVKLKLKEKNFASIKFSLYDQIQSSLRDYHEQNNKHIKAWGMLQSVDILLYKNLISQAEVLNLKAKKLLISIDNQHLLSRALYNEIKLLTAPEKVEKDTSKCDSIYDEILLNLKSLAYMSENALHMSRVTTPIRQGLNKNNPLHQQIMDGIADSKLISAVDSELSDNLRLSKYTLELFVHNFEGNFQKSVQANLKIVALALKDLDYRINARYIIVCYRNLLGSCVNAKDWETGSTAIEELEKIAKNDIVSSTPKIFSYYMETYILCIGYLFSNLPSLSQVQLDKLYNAQKYLESNRAFVEQLREDTIILIYYYLSLLSFRQFDYSQTLSYINDFFIYRKDNNRFQQIISSIRVLQIVCLFSTEQYDVFNSYMRNFKRNKDPYLGENFIVNYTLDCLSNDIKSNRKKTIENIDGYSMSGELDIALQHWLKQKYNLS